MKTIFDYIKGFAFKNFFGLVAGIYILWLIAEHPELKSELLILETLILKHFFDSNTGSEEKNKTISQALDKAQSQPAATGVDKAQNVTVNQVTPTNDTAATPTS